MTQFQFNGPWPMRLSSVAVLCWLSVVTYGRRLFGRRMAHDWDTNFEIGIRFWRHQFTSFFRERNPSRGRARFDSLVLSTDEVYQVTEQEQAEPKGCWYTPDKLGSTATLLYCHGGGYALHGAVSRRFAAMLCARIGARVFAPDYRLTPEHPHPAQAEDALAAWRHVVQTTPADQVVVIGDSAGGHMALMLLQSLRQSRLAQPALCVALCPWTDIGDCGASMTTNNRFDMVQGWMAVQFGKWLDPEGKFTRAELSPISHDFVGLAPIYIQAGGREVLRDMIRSFAAKQRAAGAQITFDEWPDMPHVFQLFDEFKKSSRQALTRIDAAVRWYVEGKGRFLE